MCVFVCVFCKSEQKHKPLHDIAFHGWQIIYLCATLHCTTSIQTTCIICMNTKYTLFVLCTYVYNGKSGKCNPSPPHETL